MTPDEREVIQAVRDAWTSFTSADSVTRVAGAYRALAQAIEALDAYADQVTTDDDAEPTECIYWVEWHDGTEGWVTGGCGYDYSTPVDAIGAAEHLYESNGWLVRVMQDLRTQRVIWKSEDPS